MSPTFAFLLAEAEPTSLGVMLAVVALAMGVIKIFEKVIVYLIAEVKRKRSARDDDGPRPGDSGRLAAPMAEVIAKMAKQTCDLHEWHAVEAPGQPGVKLWWNTTEQGRIGRELEQKVGQLLDELQQMAATHASCNESQACHLQKQRDAVEELRRRVDELQELRLADRDMLYERVIQVTNVFAARIERGVDPGSGFGQAGVEPESDG